MKKIIKLDPDINPITVKDGRGIISTFYPQTEDIKEWSYIVTLKGSVRGHHYHKEFDEYIMFVGGSGVYTELTEDNQELVTPVATGDCIFIPKFVPHTFYPTSDSKAIALITKKWNDCNEPLTRVDKETVQ